MNKKKYIEELRYNLRILPNSEIDDIVSDYEEHFDIGKKKGRNASEIAKSLGDPKELAKQFKAQYYVEKADKTKSVKNITRAILATIGLGFLNLIFVLGPLLGLFGIIIGIYAASVGIAVAGLAVLIASFTAAPYSFFLAGVGLIGISLICLGILIFIGNMALTKGVYILVIKYLKFNMSLVTSGDSK